jgi:hypothetical protein
MSCRLENDIFTDILNTKLIRFVIELRRDNGNNITFYTNRIVLESPQSKREGHKVD